MTGDLPLWEFGNRWSTITEVFGNKLDYFTYKDSQTDRQKDPQAKLTLLKPQCNIWLFKNVYKLNHLKDTHREEKPSKKTQIYAKSMCTKILSFFKKAVFVGGTNDLDRFFKKNVLIFQNKSLFVMPPFCTPLFWWFNIRIRPTSFVLSFFFF